MEDAGDVPRLTVVVPAWNAERSIGAALASVLEERDVPLECIVVDDGSEDATASIVEQAARADPRIRLVRSPVNEGASAARNRALELARGEWLGFLDADDRLRPGGLRAMIRAADGSDALAVVGQRISTDGERSWFPVLYDLPDIRRPGIKSVAANPGLLYYAGPAGKLVHRSCVDGLRFEGRVLGDQPWMLRALLRAGERIVVIEDVVYEWHRPHPARYVPTLTSARERSATLAADAVRMAGVAFELVTAEVARTVEPERREALAVAYFERLIRADLAAQLGAAVRRSDPDLAVLFDALRSFVAEVPPAVVRSTTAVTRSLLEPPLRHWPRLTASGRAAYRALLATALEIDAGIPDKGSDIRARAALRLISGSANGTVAGIASFVSTTGQHGPLEPIARRIHSVIRRRR